MATMEKTISSSVYLTGTFLAMSVSSIVYFYNIKDKEKSIDSIDVLNLFLGIYYNVSQIPPVHLLYVLGIYFITNYWLTVPQGGILCIIQLPGSLPLKLGKPFYLHLYMNFMHDFLYHHLTLINYHGIFIERQLVSPSNSEIRWKYLSQSSVCPKKRTKSI